MNNAIIMRDCTMTIDVLRLHPEVTDFRVIGEVRSTLGLRSGVFFKADKDGACRMLGKAQQLEDHLLYEQLLSAEHLNEHYFGMGQVFLFQRAQIESGIFIRTGLKQISTRRNESLVITDQGIIIKVDRLIALVDEKGSRVMATFVRGKKYERTSSCAFVGTKSANVSHIFSVKPSELFLTTPTNRIVKQIVILSENPSETVVSPPSNRFRPT